ncbi:MAG: NADH-quinone oxidoreductase subunit C [Thiotrichaceae bacterium]
MILEQLLTYISEKLDDKLVSSKIEFGELTIEVKAVHLMDAVYFLLNDDKTACDELIDVCGVDYLSYGQAEWETGGSGFSRGVQPTGAERFTFDEKVADVDFDGLRYAVVYHFLSVANNHRIRLKAFCEDNDFPVMDSVVEVWSSANWFEREAFDLYGIMFTGHPDLRRILTDYGFVGHPFRKDFPLVGHVEMRYDEEEKRVVYEPVSIEPRVLVPRVIRGDESFTPPVEGDD